MGGGKNCCAAFYRAMEVQGVHGALGVGIWVYGVLEYFDILASCRKRREKREVHFLPYMRNPVFIHISRDLTIPFPSRFPGYIPFEIEL